MSHPLGFTTAAATSIVSWRVVFFDEAVFHFTNSSVTIEVKQSFILSPVVVIGTAYAVQVMRAELYYYGVGKLEFLGTVLVNLRGFFSDAFAAEIDILRN
jgi:hypothetical protein